MVHISAPFASLSPLPLMHVTGYSLALSVGSAMQTSFGEGVWQPAYFIFGGLGVGVAALVVGTIRTKPTPKPAASTSVEHQPRKAVLSVAELARYWLSSPTLILLCIAGGVRNAGGYVWADNTASFFKDFRGVPDNVFESYMGLIPLIGGSLVRLARETHFTMSTSLTGACGRCRVR